MRWTPNMWWFFFCFPIFTFACSSAIYFPLVVDKTNVWKFHREFQLAFEVFDISNSDTKRICNACLCISFQYTFSSNVILMQKKRWKLSFMGILCRRFHENILCRFNLNEKSRESRINRRKFPFQFFFNLESSYFVTLSIQKARDDPLWYQISTKNHLLTMIGKCENIVENILDLLFNPRSTFIELSFDVRNKLNSVDGKKLACTYSCSHKGGLS